ncbi:Cytoplasmic FMR1-interacting protein [Meloidogyne graminicola]|uniref:Cytoplasmic FMR1-interacting protein n=1 Tax=Meloidogyne graminicola TaxID=189291 RepID=A0A8S9ZY53_9BILA|nr:Cytoplasmic FMR1-interacting protein [Meloidogyne graminicola]
MSLLNNDSSNYQNAIRNVQSLDELQIIDDQPCIEGNSQSLLYYSSLDTKFEDRGAFITGCSKYIEEANRQAEFEKILNNGFQHAANLYTWRCCSRAVPMPRSNDQPNRVEINEKIVQVLSPEIQKLNDFMRFTSLSIDRFIEEFQSICHPEKRKDFISESLLLMIGKLLNMFVVLDALKDMKASIKNDLSTFHRASQSPEHSLTLFLATQNRIKQTLKDKIQKIDGFEEILADLIDLNVYFFEQKLYTTPEEKHTHVKVIAFCFYLMNVDIYNKLEQKKRISIQKVDKIFKSVEVVPLFGDMNILPFTFISQCKHPNQCAGQCKCYDPNKWPLSNIEAEKCHVNITNKLSQIREQHNHFITNLGRIRNEFSIYNRKGPLNDNENKKIAELTLNGLQLLCLWSSDVIETIAWKLLNPSNNRKNPECPENAETYELATKYNYNCEEKSAIIEIISMVKGIQSLLGQMEDEFCVAIRQHIYVEMRDFVGGILTELQTKALKHKKDVLSCILTAIIETCSDQSIIVGSQLGKFSSRSSELSSSSKLLKKGKKLENIGSMPDLRIGKRNVVPSNTQLYLARTMLESIIYEKSMSTGRRIYKKEIDEKYREKMVNFLRCSYFWSTLLEFKFSLEKCADFSQLWFREFFLEMAMGTRIQFPIDMSLPWIFVNFILDSSDSALLECILFQLDLYNDAASFALKMFKKQFLYDEVEAEVNLCFDQFIYKLSEAIFTYYKQLAATMLLDKEFKSDCTQYFTIRTPSAIKFETLFRQRHFQLLGRSIDLNRLISQRINACILRSLENSITKFESEALYFIIVLDNLLEVNRLCHRLLSENLGSLANFDDLFAEANRQVSSQNGRITLHIYSELNDDLFPNFCYNTTTKRFVRGKINYRNPPDRGRPPVIAAQYEFGSKSLNAAFYNLSMMYSGFIGFSHFRIIAKLIGYQGIAAILGDLLSSARRLLNDQIKTHVRVLFGLAPKQCKLQRFDYGIEGNLQYFVHQLRTFFGYNHLRKEFCQCLREFGNILTFILGLEMGLAHEEMFDLLSASSFTGQIPKPYAKSSDEEELKIQRLETKYSRLQIASICQQFGTESQAKVAVESELLTRERLCCGLNIFGMVLNRLKETLLLDPIWNGPKPLNGVMSGFLFVLCFSYSNQTTNINQNIGGQSISNEDIYSTLKKTNNSPAIIETIWQGLSIEELFGDGIYWTGCTLIRLLGQHRRFEVLDFCYHLLRVNRTVGGTIEGKEHLELGSQQKIAINQLIDRIRRVQAQNNQLFTILNNYVANENVETIVRNYPPPVYQPQSLHYGNGETHEGSAL